MIKPETLDDLWHLERIIEKGDLIKGTTTRKIKGKDENSPTIREKIFVQINVETIEFQEIGKTLKINGKIVSGKPVELIEIGAYQSLEIEQAKNFEIIKNEWKQFHIDRIKKAEKATHKEALLLVLLDDEASYFYLLKEFGFSEKNFIRSKKSGKMLDGENWKNDYFLQILKKLEEIGSKKIVIAGPGFIKDELKDFLKKKNFEQKIFVIAANSTGITGLNEMLKGKQLSSVTEEMELLRESELVEKIFEEIGKNSGLASYGFEPVLQCVNSGAVETLLVLDNYFFEKTNNIEQLMKKTEQMNGKVHIVNSKNDAGKKIESIGKIAALLRFQSN